MKQVFDPEAPVSTFEIDTETKRALPPKGSPPVLSPYDENALEAALKIKDKQDAVITVISMGCKLSKPVLQASLAVGADELIILQDDAFEDLDTRSTAFVISNAIKKLEGYDLVLCGRQASDTNAGQVGSYLAGMLELPCLTVVSNLDVKDECAYVKKEVPEGYEVLKATLPVVITAGSEVGELRLSTVKEMMASRKKKPKIWQLSDLGIEENELNKNNFLELNITPARAGDCEMIEDENPDDAAVNLAIRLKEMAII
jgi:electron transfer flavoprotein beta subunit